jgi:DNA-binding NtrC family response regulator
MKILYVNPRHDPGPATEFLKQGVHEVTSVAGTTEALDTICTQRFDAVLIGEEIEDSAGFDFILKVHRQQPELLVFKLSVWRSELAETFELLESMDKGDDLPQ